MFRKEHLEARRSARYSALSYDDSVASAASYMSIYINRLLSLLLLPFDIQLVLVAGKQEGGDAFEVILEQRHTCVVLRLSVVFT